MKSWSLSHVTDGVLLQELGSLVRHDRATTAALLAHLAEVDRRKLYLPAAYPSMFAYCVRELKMSEETAYRRIRTARVARHFPAVFDLVADGRLNVTTVVQLAPLLNKSNARELLAVAAHKTRSEVQQLLAERFPRRDVPTSIRRIPQVAPTPAPGDHASASEDVGPLCATEMAPLAPAPVVPSRKPEVAQEMEPVLRESDSMHATASAPEPRARIAPLAPQRFALQVTLDQETHDLLRKAQELLGHALPAGDVARVLNRALRELVQRLERRRFAKTERPLPARTSRNPRHVPARIKREVSRRDGDRCTFVGPNGRRCESRTRLEFDHVVPLARGGETTVSNLRLRCRAHNQFEAERVFGAGFMAGKQSDGVDRCAPCTSP